MDLQNVCPGGEVILEKGASSPAGSRMKQDQETLGRYLRRERQMRHATIEEVALFNGVQKSLVEALEADEFDRFVGSSECRQLVKRYAAYLKLNQTEVLRIFEEEWKKSRSVKPYPKLTQFSDLDFHRKTGARFKRRGARVAGNPLVKMGWLSLIIGLLILVPLILYYLPDKVQNESPLEESLPPLIEKKAAPIEERVPQTAAKAGSREGATKAVPSAEALSLPESRLKGSLSPAGGRVIGNSDTKRYHLPGMKYYDKIKEYHRVVFKSEQEAIRAGYVKARE
jgi:hypothetical protein